MKVREPAVLALAVSLAACTTGGTLHTVESAGVIATTSEALALQKGMRELWADHVIWTRSYIATAVANHPSASAAANRLLRNQDEIGNAIVPYYGREAGARLGSLLRDHINIAVELVDAAKAGDNVKVADADRRWHDNAAEIATFLSNANPNWTRQSLQTMLNEHLSLTTQATTARLQQRWTDEVNLFDRIFDQAMQMADALSEGILRQFPPRA